MEIQSYFLLALISTTLLTSCLTIRPNAPAKETNIISKERLGRLIIHYVNTNQTTFDWSDAASDRMIYSALVQGEKPILTISYSVGPKAKVKWGAFYRRDAMPDNWKAKRDSIINFILEKEKKYQSKPELKKYDLLPYGLDNKMPLIKIIVTDPSVIRPLREGEDIRISPSHFSF